jgi:hypothetical protein
MSKTPTRSEGGRAKFAVAAAVLLALAGAAAWFWWTYLGPYVDTLGPRPVAYAGVGLLALGLGAMYLWRRASLWRLRRGDRRTRQALLERARQAADDASAKLVDLAAVTLEWAVRAELMREDLRDVEEYMIQLAKRSEVHRVLVARRDGLVTAATDKTLRNQKLDRVVEGLPSESSDIQSVRLNNRILRLIVPVMGLESRFGTLVLECKQSDILSTLGEPA